MNPKLDTRHERQSSLARACLRRVLCAAKSGERCGATSRRGAGGASQGAIAQEAPAYEYVTVVSFNADDDRCINLMNMANMGLDYIDSYVCMTGHAKPRGTLQRYDK